MHRNFPLPAGTDDNHYLSALNQAIDLIQSLAPKYLVLSAGMDLYSGDPLGTFKVTKAGIQEIGNRIANLHLPTLIVLEGGYNNAALGENFAILLKRFS